MGIYGNTFKPIEPPSLIAITMLEDVNDYVLQEAENLEVVSEARFHLFKIGDDPEYKRFKKDLSDADQILNANNESIEVNKVGHALLHGTDKIVSAVNAGTSVGALVNIFLLPVALVSKLASVALKTGKEKEALAYANEAIGKLESIRDTSENPAEKERVQKCIDKLQQSKYALEVGNKTIRKQKRDTRREARAIKREERRQSRQAKADMRRQVRAAKKGKDLKDDDDDEEVLSQVEAAELLEFCLENGVVLSVEQIRDLQFMMEQDAPSSDNSYIKDTDFKTEENSRGDDPTIDAAKGDSTQTGGEPCPCHIEDEIEKQQKNDEFVNDYDEDVKKNE